MEPIRNLQRSTSMLGFPFRVMVLSNDLGGVLFLEKKFAVADKMISLVFSIQKAFLSQAQTDALFNTELAYIQVRCKLAKIIE
ncbi:hypothetical protein [Methylacidiphilum caldifontis]|uniref:Uncharacterized protein n=1 Tax=Methylacidiphilum caldifontis TaxID=2795386 RepID=A0A4Y8PH51_9BACT|nr:hypothetical protein [Methylacidiphilum caldifontis]TFE72918.1 hypothetical protein A7Q10_03345 [Methylacidiphilum caldifontis]